jgi:hypothetical protein
VNAKSCVCIALVTLGSVWSASLHGQSTDARMGHWAQHREPRSVGMHLTYEDLGDGRFRLTLFPHYAPVDQQIVEAKCDGGTYPYVSGTGTPTGSTFSCRATGPRSFEYLRTQADQKVWATSEGIETVAEDGNTLTWLIVHKDTTGRTVEELSMHFSRRDDEPPRN